MVLIRPCPALPHPCRVQEGGEQLAHVPHVTLDVMESTYTCHGASHSRSQEIGARLLDVPWMTPDAMVSTHAHLELLHRHRAREKRERPLEDPSAMRNEVEWQPNLHHTEGRCLSATGTCHYGTDVDWKVR